MVSDDRDSIALYNTSQCSDTELDVTPENKSTRNQTAQSVHLSAEYCSKRTLVVMVRNRDLIGHCRTAD